MTRHPLNAEALQFHVLSGPEFEDARWGKRTTDGHRLAPPWLQTPRLKYFDDRSVLQRGPDRRVFFMATREAAQKAAAGTREAVAMLEIDQEGCQQPTVGIKYVSVLEPFRKRGLALKLYELLTQHLLATGERLYRTRPGAQTPQEFTAAVTRLLEHKGINWYTRDSLSG